MKRIFTILIVGVCLASCESFLELDAPKTQIITAKVFENDAGARAALAGVYSQLMSGTTFASGGAIGITTIAALSADELDNHSTSADRTAIYDNSLTPVNSVSSLWSDMYFTIYQANAILEGMQASSAITADVKEQIVGQALFIRAFAYFYLVNLYGDVPLLLSTDYRINSKMPRTSIVEVYEQIEGDLRKSQSMLIADYSFSKGEKVEPNRSAATALLARAYLYQQKWADAEMQASSIIEDPQFSLVPDLNSVFLANSSEAIWQLMPVLPGHNTFDGPYFYGEYEVVDVSVTSSLLEDFEPGDNRLSSWIANAVVGDLNYNYANKYKVIFSDMPLTEYQMVFRLAEQYLIRAEARAMQGNLSEAIDDINVIRSRAGLGPIDATGLSQQQVIDAIQKERRSELFIEWGHRWFDLKRWGKIDEVLSAVKPGWQSKDAVFPIPQSEINANPNLKQNP